MKITVTIDDELMEKARQFAEPSMDPAELFNEALKTFTRVQSAKRLLVLGGTKPKIRNVPRRKSRV